MTTDRRGWRDHPLIQLTLVRYREFYREPEAIFWVFIFPVLLTAGLGIAFRGRGSGARPGGAGGTRPARMTRWPLD